MQQVHEIDGRALHLEHQIRNPGGKIVVAEVGDDTDDQAADGGHHGGVDAVGEQGDVDVVAGLGHVEESLDHTHDGAEESDHRGAAGDGGERRETPLQAGDFDVAGILDGGLDVAQGPSDPLDALADQAGDRGVITLAEREGGFDLAFVDVVADVVHEVLVHLGGTADQPPFLAENIDGYDAEDQEYDHQPAALAGHLDQGISLLLGNGLHGCGRSGRRISYGFGRLLGLETGLK